jgi:hypothetical protein
VGKAVKEMRDKKDIGDEKVPGYTQFFGRKWSQNNNNMYETGERPKNFT